MIMWSEGLLVIVLLVLIGVNAFVLGRGRRGAKEDHTAADDEVDNLRASVAASQAENRELRDRIEVLERLATDEDARLARDINRLKGGRDDRPGA